MEKFQFKLHVSSVNIILLFLIGCILNPFLDFLHLRDEPVSLYDSSKRKVNSNSTFVLCKVFLFRLNESVVMPLCILGFLLATNSRQSFCRKQPARHLSW